VEQKSISMFLDSETAKIDSLVEAQEKLIELLREKRQVVISEAVTKGLNSKVKVKDSGVAWLGKVPESWDVVRLKKITSRISSGKTPSGGAEVYVDIGVIFLRSQNVYDEGLRLEDVVRIPEKIDAEMSSSRVKGGDILLNITGGSIGRSCCLPYDFESANVNQHVCAIRLSDPDMVSFVELFFKSDIIKKQIDYIQNGAAREGLNFEQIGNFSICIPPPDERKLLVEVVKRKIKNFNDLISQIIESTSLLQERRSALISAAVSGQIDVRTTNGN
jgi:type I restriction enzyme S subunit